MQSGDPPEQKLKLISTDPNALRYDDIYADDVSKYTAWRVRAEAKERKAEEDRAREAGANSRISYRVCCI